MRGLGKKVRNEAKFPWSGTLGTNVQIPGVDSCQDASGSPRHCHSGG